jgi:sulfonate transport system substrate-binding protein
MVRKTPGRKENEPKSNFMKNLKNILAATVFAAAAVLARAETIPARVTLDYAYYNPVSLVLKEKKYLETDLAKDGTKVEWVFSQGSNKSLEYLNSKSVDFGSTAGVAAFISRANGNPVKSVYVYSKPEWTALLVRQDSKLASVADLKGKKVAATRGTDPFVFLSRALDENGLTIKDIELVPLQHADGKNALLRGDVDAWAGLDPLMAQAEVDSGAKFLFRDASLNTYGVLNVRDDFARDHAELIVRVLKAYEQARLWALAHPAEFKPLVITQAKLNEAVAAKVLERTGLANSRIGEDQKKAIRAAGDVLKKNLVIGATVDLDQTVEGLIEPRFAAEAVK